MHRLLPAPAPTLVDDVLRAQILRLASHGVQDARTA
jgi:hypothetical protein